MAIKSQNIKLWTSITFLHEVQPLETFYKISSRLLSELIFWNYSNVLRLQLLFRSTSLAEQCCGWDTVNIFWNGLWLGHYHLHWLHDWDCNIAPSHVNHVSIRWACLGSHRPCPQKTSMQDPQKVGSDHVPTECWVVAALNPGHIHSHLQLEFLVTNEPFLQFMWILANRFHDKDRIR